MVIVPVILGDGKLAQTDATLDQRIRNFKKVINDVIEVETEKNWIDLLDWKNKTGPLRAPGLVRSRDDQARQPACA